MRWTRPDPTGGPTLKGALLVAGAALALSACAPPPGGGQAQPPTTAAPDQSQGGQPAGPSSSDGPGHSRSAAPSTARKGDSDEDRDSSGGNSKSECQTSQLDAKLYPQGPGVQGDIGTTAALRVANIGSSPCTVNGWGEVEADGEKGSLPTRVAHNRGMDDPEEHTLKPGQGVVKGLIWNNYRTSDHCSLPKRLKVFPPGSDDPLLVDWNERNEICDNGSLETGPFDTEQWTGVHVPGAMADS